MLRKKFSYTLNNDPKMTLDFEEAPVSIGLLTLETIKWDEIWSVRVMDAFMGEYFRYDGKKEDWRKMNIDYEKIYEIIFRDYLWWMLSPREDWVDQNYAPPESLYESIWHRYWIIPTQLIQQISYSEMKSMLTWMEWNINEQTEDWKKRNQQNRINSMTPEEKESVDLEFKELSKIAENYFKNKE